MTTYRMSGKTYTRDELREVSKAEAADLPPEIWRDGIFNFNDYLTESIPVASRQDAREGGFVASCDCARLGTRARVAGWDLLVVIS